MHPSKVVEVAKSATSATFFRVWVRFFMVLLGVGDVDKRHRYQAPQRCLSTLMDQIKGMSATRVAVKAYRLCFWGVISAAGSRFLAGFS